MHVGRWLPQLLHSCRRRQHCRLRSGIGVVQASSSGRGAVACDGRAFPALPTRLLCLGTPRPQEFVWPGLDTTPPSKKNACCMLRCCRSDDNELRLGQPYFPSYTGGRAISQQVTLSEWHPTSLSRTQRRALVRALGHTLLVGHSSWRTRQWQQQLCRCSSIRLRAARPVERPTEQQQQHVEMPRCEPHSCCLSMLLRADTLLGAGSFGRVRSQCGGHADWLISSTTGSFSAGVAWRTTPSKIPTNNSSAGARVYGVCVCVQVYKGRWHSSDVAIKIVTVRSPEELPRVLREAEVMMQLDHPNIVRAFHASVWNPAEQVRAPTCCAVGWGRQESVVHRGRKLPGCLPPATCTLPTARPLLARLLATLQPQLRHQVDPGQFCGTAHTAEPLGTLHCCVTARRSRRRARHATAPPAGPTPPTSCQKLLRQWQRQRPLMPSPGGLLQAATAACAGCMRPQPAPLLPQKQ